MSTQALEYNAILYGDPCSYCGGPGGAIDHIDPSSRPIFATYDMRASWTSEAMRWCKREHRRQLEDWSNRTAACARCNSIKGIAPLLEALLRM